MMLRFLAVISVVGGLLAGSASAAANADQGKPEPAKVEPKEQRRPSNTTPERPAEQSLPMRASANIRVELTISDSLGSAAAQKKTVTMTIADRRMGRIRSSRSNFAILNVDATPTIAEGNRIHLQLTLEYLPEQSGESASRFAPINEMISVVLDNGKPMTISQAADPALDRRVAVEVNATILK
jgi:hypothetical protein